MKVSGFSFIRNAIKYDYPIKEAILSILPLCDEFVIAVGNSDDNTRNLVENISGKIKIIDTIWDDTVKEGGKVLALETDKALEKISKDSDWAFYIQGDEILHEKYLEEVKSKMATYKNNKSIDGLLFGYKHFYGSYDYTGISSNWYRREIRVIRPNINAYSYRDAQGFRKNNGEKLNVKLINAKIYHYGWVKPPKVMYKKQNNFASLYNVIEKHIDGKEFDYSNIGALNIFKGTHPKVMEGRINSKNWKFSFDISVNKFSVKDKIKKFFIKNFKWYIGEYRNYILKK